MGQKLKIPAPQGDRLGIYDSDLGDADAADPIDVVRQNTKLRDEAGLPEGDVNTELSGTLKEQASGLASNAPKALFTNNQFEAVYEDGKFVGIRDALSANKELGVGAQVIKLDSIDSIRSLVADQKMNAIIEFPTKYEDVSYYSEFYGSVGKKEYGLTGGMKSLGSGYYDSNMEVYIKGELQGIFDSRSIPSDNAKFATIDDGYYIATHHRHQGKYDALQLVNPGLDGDGTYKFAEEIARANDLGSRQIPTIGQNPAHPKQDWASGINIHHAGVNDFTGVTRRGTGVTEGCQVVATSQWNKFISIVGSKTNGKYDATYFNTWIIRR